MSENSALQAAFELAKIEIETKAAIEIFENLSSEVQTDWLNAIQLNGQPFREFLRTKALEEKLIQDYTYERFHQGIQQSTNDLPANIARDSAREKLIPTVTLKFDGEGNLSWTDFKKKVHTIIQVAGYFGDRKIAGYKQLLDGTALKWYENSQFGTNDGGTWENFDKEMIRLFDPTNNFVIALVKLLCYSISNQTLASTIADFTKLFKDSGPMLTEFGRLQILKEKFPEREKELIAKEGSVDSAFNKLRTWNIDTRGSSGGKKYKKIPNPIIELVNKYSNSSNENLNAKITFQKKTETTSSNFLKRTNSSPPHVEFTRKNRRLDSRFTHTGTSKNHNNSTESSSNSSSTKDQEKKNESQIDKSRIICKRCNRPGHLETNCFAITTNTGESIDLTKSPLTARTKTFIFQEQAK